MPVLTRPTRSSSRRSRSSSRRSRSSSRRSRSSSRRSSSQPKPKTRQSKRKSRRSRSAPIKKSWRLNLDRTPNPRCPVCKEELRCGNPLANLISERSCDYKTSYDGGFGYRAVYCGHCGAVLGVYGTGGAKAAKEIQKKFYQ